LGKVKVSDKKRGEKQQGLIHFVPITPTILPGYHKLPTPKIAGLKKAKSIDGNRTKVWLHNKKECNKKIFC